MELPEIPEGMEVVGIGVRVNGDRIEVGVFLVPTDEASETDRRVGMAQWN